MSSREKEAGVKRGGAGRAARAVQTARENIAGPESHPQPRAAGSQEPPACQPTRLPSAPSLADYAAAARDESIGLVCGKCGCRHFDVDATRHVRGGIRRYRVCRNCGRRVATVEKFGS